MNIDDIVFELKAAGNPDNLEGMSKVGIAPDKAFGTKLPEIRKLARRVGKSHGLAAELWSAGYRETMILASMVDEPDLVSMEQMRQWATDFSYWEICDQCCMNLFHLLPFAKDVAVEWTREEGEQQKRAGFALMAVLAWKDKKASDDAFSPLIPHIERGALDERGPVKKAVSWALRSIGKRNAPLNAVAIESARRIEKLDTKSARWVAKDVLRELTSENIAKRLGKTG